MSWWEATISFVLIIPWRWRGGQGEEEEGNEDSSLLVMSLSRHRLQGIPTCPGLPTKVQVVVPS